MISSIFKSSFTPYSIYLLESLQDKKGIGEGWRGYRRRMKMVVEKDGEGIGEG